MQPHIHCRDFGFSVISSDRTGLPDFSCSVLVLQFTCMHDQISTILLICFSLAMRESQSTGRFTYMYMYNRFAVADPNKASAFPWLRIGY